MKIFFTGLLLFSVLGINGSAQEPFMVTKNAYDDTFITVNNVTNGRAKKELIQEIKKQKSSFFVELPLVCEDIGLSAAELIQKHGFSVYHTNNTRMRLIKLMKNDPIPPIVTGNNTVKIFVSRQVNDCLQVLFTEEGNRLATSLPGGTLEYREDICTGAVRELKEELELKVSKDQLLFLGVLNRIKAFEYQITHNEFLFHLPYDGQKIVPDGKEVKGFAWEYVDDVIESGQAIGLPVLEHHLAVLRSLNEGKHGKPIVSMLDLRQMGKREEHKNPNDIMIFCPAE
jgi:8-oxo-dGTP pyrophosphatase MutT (NUDIX family)